MSKFQLPKQIEPLLATMEKMYRESSDDLVRQVLVNSSTRVQEETSYDNLDGGIYGHSLTLIVPESLHYGVIKRKYDIEQQLERDLNRLNSVQSEFIDSVKLEFQLDKDHDWRKTSALLLPGRRPVAPDVQNRLWRDGIFRVFLSHKSSVKTETAQLKQQLAFYGIDCFVAHDDIEPTTEWLEEIKLALSSMDALVALLTPDFRESNWTDQEVGFAFGRGVPIVCVNLGTVPYGFMGQFQGLNKTWTNAALEIVKLLVKYERMVDAYITATKACARYEDGNLLASILPFIKVMTPSQADRFVEIYNNNLQLNGCFGFTGVKPKEYGDGLKFHLKRLTGKDYQLNPD